MNIEHAVGADAGESRTLPFQLVDGKTTSVTVTVKEIKEKVPPPLDDELARAASEFETLDELRAEIEGRLLAQAEATVAPHRTIHRLLEGLEDMRQKRGGDPDPRLLGSHSWAGGTG